MSVLSGNSIMKTFVFEHRRYPREPGGWVPSGSTYMIEPLVERQQHRPTGTSFGLSMCGYDIRLGQDIWLPPGRTVLASTLERFNIPNDVMAVVHDKSTWARRGISVQNTVIEPGWEGYLTLEILLSPLQSVPSTEGIKLLSGTPIAQVILHRVDEETEGYLGGKYQNQERGPQEAR